MQIAFWSALYQISFHAFGQKLDRTYVTVTGRLSLLLLPENFAGVFDDLSKIFKTLFDVFNIQALLSSVDATLGVHRGDIVGDKSNDLSEIIDHLLARC